MPYRIGVAHRFVPFEGGRGIVAASKQAQPDVHADEMMLMGFEAKSPHGTQDPERLLDVLLRQAQPALREPGEPAQHIIAASVREPCCKLSMRGSLGHLPEMDQKQREVGARVSFGPRVVHLARHAHGREQRYLSSVLVVIHL